MDLWTSRVEMFTSTRQRRQISSHWRKAKQESWPYCAPSHIVNVLRFGAQHAESSRIHDPRLAPRAPHKEPNSDEEGILLSESSRQLAETATGVPAGTVQTKALKAVNNCTDEEFSSLITVGIVSQDRGMRRTLRLTELLTPKKR